ncbi:hypothetical protein HADU_06679 [Acinetobacter sp. HA]|uniref:hypothetical protein n=1 Tax=Acinetobacter sp. HA TaxID=1173062 RepID=UPI000263E6A5|nr:hypothetical protein [Acinetobacter sp. HA]EIM39511.1 hypothetical protein HADU_06679 [Acinetobacter sp. HA]
MNLTIEQMREIVDGAPIGTTHANTNSHFKENDYGVWSVWDGYWNSAFRWPEGEMFLLSDLRAALADHDRTDYVSDIRNHISPTTVVIER